MYGIKTPMQLRFAIAICLAGLSVQHATERSATAQAVRVQIANSASAPRVAKDDPEAKRLLALDVAAVAARNGLFDVSVDAVTRAAEKPVVTAKPEFQSTLLGGQAARTSPVFNLTNSAQPEPAGQAELRRKLELLADIWKEKKAPPEKVALALQRIVLPASDKQEVQTLAPIQPSNASYYYFDLSRKLPAPPRVLGLEAVEWTHRAGQLDAMIDELKKRAEHPTARMPAKALLLYAYRLAGKPELAAESLKENAFTEAEIKGESKQILYAIRKVPPDDVAASELNATLVDDFVFRALAADPNNLEARNYVLQGLVRSIERGSEADVTRYAQAVESSIDNFESIDASQKTQMKVNFQASVERECIRLERIDLALDFAIRQYAAGEGIPRFYSDTTQNRLVAVAKGSAEQRLARARRLLLDVPLTSMEQLSFAPLSRPSRPPEFFQAHDDSDEAVARLTPFEGADTISLLDLLLNEAEQRGKADETVAQLFKNAENRDDIIKLIAQWLMHRAHQRDQAVDAKIAALGHFENEGAFITWLKRIPHSAATALLAEHTADGPLSDPVLALLEQPENADQNWFGVLVRTEGFGEKYYRQKNPSAPPLRSASQLKHWCAVRPLYSNIRPESERLVFSVPTANGIQGLKHYGVSLVLRYPVVGDVTVVGTFTGSKLNSNTLGVNGMSVILSDSAVVAWGQQRDYTSPSIPLTEQSTVAWSHKEEKLSLTIDEKVRTWRQPATAAPFVTFQNNSFAGAVPADFTITGEVHIPQEVPLIDKGLSGWTCPLFGHPLPSMRLAIEETSVEVNWRMAVDLETEQSRLVWREQSGEIRVGKRPDNESQPETVTPEQAIFGTPEEPAFKRQTWISYERPLLEGERIEFELYHDSKGQTVAPALGRLAYCPSGEKISLHWIGAEAELKRLKMAEDNRADDPAGQQLAAIQLEDNAWNRMAMRIEAGSVVLSVADKDVYRRPLAGDESTLFGFFADPTAPETRIRNIVLKGDWPTQLPQDLWELDTK